jgi:hypothetical protein
VSWRGQHCGNAVGKEKIQDTQHTHFDGSQLPGNGTFTRCSGSSAVVGQGKGMTGVVESLREKYRRRDKNPQPTWCVGQSEKHFPPFFLLVQRFNDNQKASFQLEAVRKLIKKKTGEKQYLNSLYLLHSLLPLIKLSPLIHFPLRR